MEFGLWWRLITRPLLLTGGGVLLGALVHRPLAGLVVAFILILLWHLAHLVRVMRWLRIDDPESAPDLSGIWGELVLRIVRLYRRKQRRKQQFLRLLRELRRSTSALPDGVVVLTPEAEIVWFNRTAGRLLGFRGKTDVGLRVENLLRQPEFVRYLRGGHYGSPVQIRVSNSPEQYLALQIVPYGAGQLLLLVRDVTREARLESMRRDFVANASHELRSPLTVIAGYLEALGPDPGMDPQLHAPIQEMRRQAARMTAIIEDLLELSRLESPEPASGGVPIDVGALMAQLRQDVLARPQHPKSVTVLIESPAQLLGEEAQIRSAFSNLVSNAAKYTPPSGSVTLRWWTDAQGAHFAVADTGIGIAPEHLPRLTERFYRVDAGRSRASGGSGLGLAIVKHALQRNGGTLEIQSREGVGSTFTSHFPPERISAVDGTPRLQGGQL